MSYPGSELYIASFTVGSTWHTCPQDWKPEWRPYPSGPVECRLWCLGVELACPELAACWTCLARQPPVLTCLAQPQPSPVPACTCSCYETLCDDWLAQQYYWYWVLNLDWMALQTVLHVPAPTRLHDQCVPDQSCLLAAIVEKSITSTS